MSQLEQKGFTRVLLISIFLSTFGSSLLIGYNIGVINLPQESIERFLSEVILEMDYEDAVQIKTGTNPRFLYTQVSVSFVVFGAIGAFSTGPIADKIGRRNGLLFNNVFAVIGGILCSCCVLARRAWLLYAGRAFVGFNSGVSIGLASIYLTEIAPQSLRGTIGSLHQLALTIGILLSYLFTFTFAMNTENLWPFAVGMGAIPAIVSLILLPFFPESPRFLHVNKKNEEAARVAFRKLNCLDNENDFIEELDNEMKEAANKPRFKFLNLFTSKELRMPIIIACVIQIFQQLSGINAVMSYSSFMLEGAGLDKAYIQYGVAAIGLLNVIMTVVSVYVIDRKGRRTLIIWPGITLAISLLILSIVVTLVGDIQGEPTSSQRSLGIVSVIFILIYVCGFALGLGPVPGLIVGELFRQEPRAAAYSLSQGINWLGNLMVLFSYPLMQAKIGGLAFLPFLVVVSVCWLFMFLFLIETKEKSFDEIATKLDRPRIVPKLSKPQWLK